MRQQQTKDIRDSEVYPTEDIRKAVRGCHTGTSYNTMKKAVEEIVAL